MGDVVDRIDPLLEATDRTGLRRLVDEHLVEDGSADVEGLLDGVAEHAGERNRDRIATPVSETDLEPLLHDVWKFLDAIHQAEVGQDPVRVREHRLADPEPGK